MQQEDNILAIIIYYLKHGEFLAKLPQTLYLHALHGKFQYKYDS